LNISKQLQRRPTTSNAVSGVFAFTVILVCILAYGQALDGPILFDDIPNLTTNTLLKIDGHHFDDWRVAAISSDAGVLYRPVAILSFAVNYVIAGDFTPVSLKATNVIIHLFTGVLIFYLCQALLQAPTLSKTITGNARTIALAAAALWLLHPLHVSTVLYAIQRMAQLSTLFVVLGLLVFTRYRLRWAVSGAGVGEIVAAAFWLLLSSVFATFSKENGALLLWLVVIVEVSLFGGEWRGQQRIWLARISWVVLLLPVLAVALVFLIDANMITDRFSGRAFSLEERLLTEGRVLWQYVSWLVFPNITSMGFFHDDIAISDGLWSPVTTALSLVAWLALISAAFLMRKLFPLLLFAVLFYLVGHSLESTVVALELVFEHRNYLPSVGICLLVAVALFHFCEKILALRYSMVLGGLLGILALQLLLRANAWTDEMTLAKVNVINHPESLRANFFYGNALFERFARADELALGAEEQKMLAVNARSYFARALELDPQSFAALVLLYQLDTLHFPGLAKENNWLGKLEEGAATRRLQASDRSAVGALVDFSLTPAFEANRERVSHILDQLVARYPRRVDLLAQQYKFAVSSGLLGTVPAVDRIQLLELLEHAAQKDSDNRRLYAYLVQYHGSESIAATYEWIRTWMLLDAERRELPMIRRSFES
jgi:hypothetical protein